MHAMDNTIAFFKELETKYGEEAGRVMQAVAVMKVEADMHNGVLNTSEMGVVSALSFLMEAAAKGVGLDKSVVIDTLKAAVEAVQADLTRIAETMKAVEPKQPEVEPQEEPVIPSPELVNYLAGLAGSTRH